MPKLWIILIAALTAVLAAGCSSGEESASSAGGTPAQGRLRVVATTTQVADFARNVGGDLVQVTSLLKPGVDAHDYEPSPADLDAIARSDLVLRNGVGWTGGWTTPSRAPATTARWSTPATGWRCVRSTATPTPTSGRTPATPRRWRPTFRGALAGAEPAAAATFRVNLAAYTKQLRALDAEVERQVDSLANKKVVTNHDAFGYYLDRYGLELVGSVIPSFDSSAELSGRDIRDLVAKIKATGVKAIFSETTLPPKTAQTIGREAGVKVVVGEGALYGDALGPPGSDGDTYLKMIRHNTATIVSNLGGA